MAAHLGPEPIRLGYQFGKIFSSTGRTLGAWRSHPLLFRDDYGFASPNVVEEHSNRFSSIVDGRCIYSIHVPPLSLNFSPQADDLF